MLRSKNRFFFSLAQPLHAGRTLLVVLTHRDEGKIISASLASVDRVPSSTLAESRRSTKSGVAPMLQSSAPKAYALCESMVRAFPVYFLSLSIKAASVLAAPSASILP